MRRLSPQSLPLLLKEHQPPPVEELPEPWRASFELRSVTPLVGGGVESMEPDQIDIVRIPSIRGQLRWWWRKLYFDRNENAEALFARETRLWGGVGPFDGTNEDARRSLVGLSVDILEAGEATPAGVHLPGRGLPKPLPQWKIGRLGYALFPLQRSNHERKAYGRNQSMPTRSVRVGLRFRLHVELLRGAEEEQDKVLAALWAWIHFGGLGARARRGFGQLRLLDVEIPTGWRKSFQVPKEGAAGFSAWFGKLDEAAALRAESPLRSVRFLGGRERREPRACLEELVGLLQKFRQGIGVGRRAAGRGEGGSNWPESQLLRGLAAGEELPELGVPRAAFGMPLEIQFIGQHKTANASIVPVRVDEDLEEDLKEDRWPSPVWFKVLPLPGGNFLPLVMAWPTELPQARIQFKKRGAADDTRQIASFEGTRPPIRDYLAAANGDAVQAFLEWAEQEERFKPINLGAFGP